MPRPSFDEWYAKIAAKWGLDPNPDDPAHQYDYRTAYQALAEPDADGHWPSTFKRPAHQNRYVDGVDTTMPQAHTPDPWDDLVGAVAKAAVPSPVIRDPQSETTTKLKQWVKEGVIGGVGRRVEGLAQLPSQLVKSVKEKGLASTALDVAEAPVRAVVDVAKDPLGTLERDPLAILEALSLANTARRGLGKAVASSKVPIATKEWHQKKSAEATTRVLSPTKAWRQQNANRMGQQEPGFEHIPSNAMPGFRLQMMADRLAPTKGGVLGRKQMATRPALTDEFLQKLDDQIIDPANTRVSELVASDPRTITAGQFIAQGPHIAQARGATKEIAQLYPEFGDKLDDVLANFQRRGPQGVEFAPQTTFMGEVVDDAMPSPTGPPFQGQQPKQLTANQLMVRGDGTQGRPSSNAASASTSAPLPDVDLHPQPVELPMTAPQMDRLKKASNFYGQKNFGKDVPPAEFYAKDTVRKDIKRWLEEGSGGTDARGVYTLPKDMSQLSMKEANMLEGDAIALQRLMAEKFQQLGASPVDNSYRLARLLSSPMQPFAPQARTALLGMGLESPAAKLATANMQWNLARQLGAARSQPLIGGVANRNTLAALLGTSGAQSQEAEDPWAALLGR